MRPNRFLATIGLCVLFALPAAAQTTSPSKSPNSPAATAPSATPANPSRRVNWSI